MKSLAILVLTTVGVFGNTPPLPLSVDDRFYLVRTETGEREAYLREEGLVLVLEPDGLHIGAERIPDPESVAYIDRLLKEKKTDRIHLFVRESSKYGAVIQATDLLRQTSARHVGLYLDELIPGVTYQ
ncbi:hypothetical protein PXH66_00105 [Synoicihabitans lomoniglobus]|uniref:Uncharacterized protein n=1 Tax=Synoicihabitans lomoniglobus TaxID=2909285 RepID=A0AAF0CP19_9BACT|nr:hypothetical protein PXH66_00105 [Opitutaceae bacterium LMO-M01]